MLNSLDLRYGQCEPSPGILAARESLIEFMLYDGKGEWQREPHLDLLCGKLQLALEGKIKRLMVFMPPRHGKSQVCSKKGPAWFLGKHPNKSVIMSSYSADLALDFSVIARNTLIDSYEIFPGSKIDPTARAKARWSIDGYPEGGLFAAGVGGPITGRGANVAIIDDPFKNFEEAQSDTVRKSVWQWYRSTLRTRLAPGGVIILIMTRWHEDDLAGRLLNEMESDGEKWEVISLPGIAEDDDVLGRTKGEPLSPRFPIEELLATKSALGPYLFGALYQQRPRPEEGNYFKAKWMVDSQSSVVSMVNSWKKDKVFVPIYAAMDLAIGEKENNDWNAIPVGGVTPGGEKFLCEVDRFRADTFGIVNHIIDIVDRWRPLLFVFENEKILKVIWPLVIKEAKQKGLTINYKHLTPINDKVTRARIPQGQLRMGEWIFPKTAPWYEEFEEEMLGFPNSKWDDQVDGFSMLSRMIADNPYEFDGMNLS